MQKPLISIISYLLFAFLALLLPFAGYIAYISSVLPNRTEILQKLQTENLDIASEVLDRSGNKIGEYTSERRYFLPSKKIPKKIVAAFIAIEDKNFFSHHGVDPIATLRALSINLSLGEHAQGASTITQQVARLYFLTPEKTYIRKIKEAILAIMIEKILSKDQILEFYLNKVYLGKGCYGITAAARIYFGKEPDELRVSEAAFLAGLVKAPSLLAPHRHFTRAKRRQKQVLKQMYKGGFISGSTYKMALADKITVDKDEKKENALGYFLAMVQKEMTTQLELPRVNQRGYRIYTSLDSSAQMSAESTIAQSLQDLDPDNSKLEGALISISTRDNAVVALMGGSNFSKTEYNRVIHLKRPIGHLIQLVAAALAMDQGGDLVRPFYSDRIPDVHATIDLYSYLVHGQNALTPQLIDMVGPGTFAKIVFDLGLSKNYFAINVGAQEIDANPLMLASALGSLFHSGRQVSPRLITKVEDLQGQLIYQYEAPTPKQIFTAKTSVIMQHALKHVANYGIGRNEEIDDQTFGVMPALGKSGRDLWAVGGRSGLCHVLWIGNESSRSNAFENQEKALKYISLAFKRYAKSVDALTPALDPRLYPSVSTYSTIGIGDQRLSSRRPRL